MSNHCSCCGSDIPEGQRICSMCCGDIDHGSDGYYRQLAEEQERSRLEKEQQDKAEQEQLENDPEYLRHQIEGLQNQLNQQSSLLERAYKIINAGDRLGSGQWLSDYAKMREGK